MSGGSMDYIYRRLDENASGRMIDRELNAMLEDFVKVLHDCEWMHSCDISREGYFETVTWFKQKWFGKRDERLKEIIEQATDELKSELLKMIGDGSNEQGTKREIC